MFTEGLADELQSQARFSKILVRTSINYRRNLMPPTAINDPFVIPSEKLLYKTPPLPIWFIFSLRSHLYFSSPLRLRLVFGRDFIVLVVVLNILKGMYSFFFIFVFFF